MENSSNCKTLKPGGIVLSIDLKKVKVQGSSSTRHCDARVKTVCADVMKLPKHQVRAHSPQQKRFSVILSDVGYVSLGFWNHN